MPTHSSSARPLLRIGAALAVAFAAAAAAVPGPALGLAAERGEEPLTSATCRVCHTDSRFGEAFSHFGLEESADGCLTCHGDADGHVAARGRKGSIAHPRSWDAEAEFELCLMCHGEEEFRTPEHLAPRGEDTRCISCHGLHGKPMPLRAGGPGAVDITPRAPELVGPTRGKAWATGRVEAGWRFVGGEEGRYEQDVDLDDGGRLFGLDLEAGLDDADPVSPRVDLRLAGLGDPHTSLRVRARKGDAWKVTLTGRRDEHPFLGQNGLHGGETLRRSFSASTDLEVSRTVTASAGWDLRSTEGDLAGTLLDNGTLIPLTGSRDRRSQEGWASVAARGRGWHASLRQAWLWEDGSDDRDRDRSLPSTPDFYAFDDDSTMTGPRTSVVAGLESRDGRFSIEGRGSRTDLSRDVDLMEMRRSVIGGSSATRTAVTDGERDLLLHEGGVDAAFAFADRWALEGGVERRTLREDGKTETVETVDSGSGPVPSRTVEKANVTHVIMEERIALRHTLEGGFTFRGGLEFVGEELSDRAPGARDGAVRSRGFFGAAEGPVAPDLTFRGEIHSAHAGGQFTPLTPRDRDTYRAAAAYRDAEGWRTGADWTLTRLEARESGLGSSGNQLRVWAGMGKPGEFTADLSYSVRQQTLEVDTRYWSSAALTGGEAKSRIRAHLLDLSLGVPISSRVSLTATAAWVLDRGTLPLRGFDGAVGLRWEVTKSLAARVEVRHREYDEDGVDALDYEADILELSLEMRF